MQNNETDSFKVVIETGNTLICIHTTPTALNINAIMYLNPEYL